MSVNQELLQGKVKFYNGKKGYGFIIEDETKKEYFFHIHDVVDKAFLAESDKVYFELLNDKTGKVRAINVFKYS